MIAEEIAAFIGSFAPVSFVTRHQLLLDLRINYASRNSCMCFEAWLTESQKQSAINFALDLLEHKCAPSAEPGIAAVFGKDILSAQGLINLGKSAKRDIFKAAAGVWRPP